MDLLCFDLVNSQWYITHKPYRDPLRDRDWLADFLEHWRLADLAAPSAAQLDELLALRSLLTEIIGTLCRKETLTGEQLAAANRYLRLAPLRYEAAAAAGQFQLELKPLQWDWNYALAKITASLFELLAHYPLDRLRQCENPDCRWVFYDDSKSSTRKWCGNTCASLIKVRKFREKHKGI